MASVNNLGRVQGAGFFHSTSTSRVAIPANTVKPTNIKPLVGDVIVNGDREALEVTAVEANSYTAKYLGNFKGDAGPAGGYIYVNDEPVLEMRISFSGTNLTITTE